MTATLIVIGAGLAGSAVAARLAQSGWQVTVLDSANAPAQAASGLPVGLMAPMISRQDTTAAQLTRAGVRAMLDECKRLTHAGLITAGQDWQPCSVIQRNLPGTPRSRLAPPSDWPEDNPWIRAHSDRQGDWLHLQAAWIKPSSLVQAWLATPGVAFIGNAFVSQLQRSQSIWHAYDASGRTIARASHAVVAAAFGSHALLHCVAGLDASKLPLLHPVGGQVAYGPWTREMDQALTDNNMPHNGNGHFIPNVPSPEGAFWLSGSTYEHSPWPEQTRHHAPGLTANIARTGSLLPPALHALLSEQRSRDHIQTWQAQRCTSPSRLPVVQTLAPGLHTCTAMGSRGLTYAWLSAEQLQHAMLISHQ